MTAGAGPAVDDPWEDIPVDGPETLAEKRLLASLGPRARAANLSRVVRLGELLDRDVAGDLDEAGRHEAENLAHQLVGSAGMFGRPGASVEAGSLERYFAASPPSGTPPRARGAAGARATIDRLREEFGG